MQPTFPFSPSTHNYHKCSYIGVSTTNLNNVSKSLTCVSCIILSPEYHLSFQPRNLLGLGRTKTPFPHLQLHSLKGSIKLVIPSNWTVGLLPLRSMVKCTVCFEYFLNVFSKIIVNTWKGRSCLHIIPTFWT